MKAEDSRGGEGGRWGMHDWTARTTYRLSSCWISSSLMASRGGRPSMTQPTPLPCDSPKVVTRKAWPKVLPAPTTVRAPRRRESEGAPAGARRTASGRGARAAVAGAVRQEARAAMALGRGVTAVVWELAVVNGWERGKADIVCV